MASQSNLEEKEKNDKDDKDESKISKNGPISILLVHN